MSSENDLTFDNRAFWNSRYIENPALGSGIGSRGDNLLHKRTIVTAFLEETRPATILDVGCGDHEVLSDLELPGAYLGIDVAERIVEANTHRFPHRSFRHVDFAALTEVAAFRADAVLCFEVLIHQHRRADYDRMVSNLLGATAEAGLLSGYVVNPRPLIQSPIIAWHEPLTETLRRLGARDVELRAVSLESDCLGFVSYRSA